MHATMSDIAVPPDVSPAETRTRQHRSPGITAIYNELKSSRDHRVLDLGPSSANNFNFFTQLSGRIRFENLNECLLDEAGSLRESEALQAALELYLNPFQEGEKFDAVLTWDLFNYLDESTVRWLMAKLAPLCRENALLHRVKYVSATIPRVPGHFQILDAHHVDLQQMESTGQRPHGGHETARLLRLMPDFYIENAYMGYEGMLPGLMEQVLRFQPQKALGARRLASDELTLHDNQASLSDSRAHLPHTSWALPVALQNRENGRAPVILDLGLKNKNNWDLLYGLTQELYAVNLYQEIRIQSRQLAEPVLKPYMLNFPAGLKFDVILAWDILNFMPPELIESLSQLLAPHLHPQTRLHAIVYSGRETPAEPQLFHIRNLSEMEIYPGEKRAGFAPLTSTRLLKALKCFRLEDTFVFRTGMQRGIYEYLFQHQTGR
jgi:hypothetical protein